MPDKTGNFAKLVQIYHEDEEAAKVSNNSRKLFFIFLYILENITQNNRLAPLSLRLALSLENSESAADYYTCELSVAYVVKSACTL